MKTDQEILDSAALKVSEILNIPVGDIDKTKFIYLYTLLYNMMGQGPDGDDNMRHWLNTYNTHLKFCPVDYLTDVDYASKIIGYLEGFND